MLKVFKSQKFQELKYNTLHTILSHQNVLEVGLSVAKSISNFATSKSSLSFIEGGVSAFNTCVKAIGGESEDLFSVDNGWHFLAASTHQQVLYDILCSSLTIYPSRQLKFSYEVEKSIIYTLPIGIVAKTRRGILYRPKENNEKELLQFIIKERAKCSNSKFFTIAEQTVVSPAGYSHTTFDLKAEENIALPSKTAENLATHIKKYMNKGISRSIIINGMPGTGKTSAAYKIFQDLNLTTLKFKYSKSTHASIIGVVSSLIEVFNIDAVMIDDFDYFTETDTMLGFLEWLNRHCKIVIAITNSLRSFPPAILRPGRIDELVTIDSLDEEVIKGVLGDLYTLLYQKVKNWPIAYINELVIRARTNPEVDYHKYIDDLQSRVDSQTRILCGDRD